MTAESDLQIASLQDCAVMELNKDLTISHLSPSFERLTGRPAQQFISRPVSCIVAGEEGDQQVFKNAIQEMHNQSFRIVFPTFGCTLEAQGILLGSDDLSICSLWVLRPYQGQLGGDISDQLKKAVGPAGSQVLSAFFTDLRAAVFENRDWYPAPKFVLCRICEGFLPHWWFERHTESCTIEHTLESRILESHDKLVEHRVLLTTLFAGGREYKGLPIKRLRSGSINQFAVRVSSPLATRRSSHPDPACSIIEDLIKIVDTALEIDIPDRDSTPDNSDDEEHLSSGDDESVSPNGDAAQTFERSGDDADATFVLHPDELQQDNVAHKEEPSSSDDQSLVIDVKLKQVINWSPPHPTEPGLEALVEDTNVLVQAKASFALRMNNYLALSRKVLTEVDQMVSEQLAVITGDAALQPVYSSPIPLGTADEDTDNDEEYRNFRKYATRGSSSRSSLSFMPPAAPVPVETPSLTKAPSLGQINTLCHSPSSSPWQSPSSSPRLSAYPHHHSRTLSRSMMQQRDRSTSIASSDESVPRIKARTASINDYEVVSPISKGAFATVYLTRKKLTGEYFAMKCLKKSDVLEKNQATNVRSERAIMITTADSPYVAKLYYTFQSREYLYIVMEYVSGGDCASLLRALTCLTEDWSKRYIAETIVAVDSLHKEGIIHRDLKPDNLLIDQRGHLKLSDFGLSTKSAMKKHLRFEAVDPKDGSQQFFGTPDYVAPETINLEKQDESTDWWAVGCLLFEFLYGIPPFNDETPQKIFENITAGNIFWPDLPAEMDASPVAKDLIKRLLTLNPEQRLGAQSVDEIKNHEFFSDIDWSTLFSQEPSFIPQIDRPDCTDYFDDRGAIMKNFSDEMLPTVSVTDSETSTRPSLHRAPSTTSSSASSRRASRLGLDSGDEQFGPFSYKNVGVLERQNHEVITKLKTEADMSKPRRLSMSSPISSCNNTSYLESAIHDSSPFASDNEESATRSAALNRVHRRRLQRKSSSHTIHSPAINFIPDILICVSNPIWRYSTEKLLRDLGCQVVSCSSGDETIRRGSSSVQFDLILIDQHLTSGLQPQDIAHILHVTVNANSTTPIILMSSTEPDTSNLFAGSLEVPVTKQGLLELLKKHCNWIPR